jgi:hypothetical protein
MSPVYYLRLVTHFLSPIPFFFILLFFKVVDLFLAGPDTMNSVALQIKIHSPQLCGRAVSTNPAWREKACEYYGAVLATF